MREKFNRFGYDGGRFAQLRSAFIAALLSIALSAISAPGIAQESIDISAENMDGFGRVVLTFNLRFDLPPYTMRSENGVLSLEFEDQLDVTLPDISGALPEFVVISRIDPDRRGLRFGLKTNVTINRIEAGERLYIDFLPADWQGLAPALPEDVVAELARRAQDAAALEDLRRRIEFARINNPEASLSVGRHPTFIRLLFNWSDDTEASFVLTGDTALLEFGWPVDIDLFPLVSDLPDEILSVEANKQVGSNQIEFKFAEGVVPRYYKNSERQYVIDIDMLTPDIGALSAEDLLAAAQVERAQRQMAEQERAREAVRGSEMPNAVPATDQIELTPQVTEIGSTIRITFPFEEETPAAVFRRGDILWMVIDSTVNINAPDNPEVLGKISDDFSTVSAGDTQIVRIRLNSSRLASLGSQGRSWVLSLGDMLMAPTEPIRLDRRQDEDGLYEVIADLDRPVRIHQLRDPEVGDVLEVVTAFPPARGIVRTVRFVDFSALASVHGLVVKPAYEGLEISLKRREAILSARGGLIVSSLLETRSLDDYDDAVERRGFINLADMVETDPAELSVRRWELQTGISQTQGREREEKRLELAQLLLANRLGFEALGVLNVMVQDGKADALMNDVLTSMAAANVVANRSEDALDLLNETALATEVDALMWRSLARAQARDFVGARADILASETIVEAYPDWVKNRYFLSAVRVGVEADDIDLALRLIGRVDFSRLSRDQASEFELLSARIDEAEGRLDEALDTYGRVIAMDVRPTHAEAVYRTIALLDTMGRLDDAKGVKTLSQASIVWRGGPVEAQMLQLLARLQFRIGDYRGAFTTVKEAAETHIETDEIIALTEEAQLAFADLYLNGGADSFDEIEALTLFYDYRYLTPSGARGDVMIRNLARRLIGVDLLEQAAGLLEYQVDTRLDGAARAQIAADLAVIHLANREPERALNVLNRTSLAGLPPTLQRQRRLLEARALIDVGRYELARDVLTQMRGREADLLRVDSFWRDQRYREAAELLERVYSERIGSVPLSQPARMNLVKAAVGYVLDDDRIGLERVRQKFSEELSNSPEWAMFDYVTRAVTQSGAGFREIAAKVAGLNSLEAFLAAYDSAYGEGGGLVPSAGSAQS